jgi:hypothetical protein
MEQTIFGLIPETVEEKKEAREKSKKLLSKLRYQLPSTSEDEARRLHQERISRK